MTGERDFPGVSAAVDRIAEALVNIANSLDSIDTHLTQIVGELSHNASNQRADLDAIARKLENIFQQMPD
jgi:hypothetical protein